MEEEKRRWKSKRKDGRVKKEDATKKEKWKSKRKVGRKKEKVDE